MGEFECEQHGGFWYTPEAPTCLRCVLMAVADKLLESLDDKKRDDGNSLAELDYLLERLETENSILQKIAVTHVAKYGTEKQEIDDGNEDIQND